jgi:mannose-6-phosphate isomerase
MVERIEPRFVERLWGSTDLSPLYGEQERRIGEVWFDAGPLLVKFLFTTQPLSVQVHPGGPGGKTEMWHILDADPDSWIWLGFKRSHSRAEVEPALADASVQDMLGEFLPKPGDTYFVPAGVVHALGPGLTLCEIQQNCDITYRLHDYGRDRPLHIEQGMAVAKLEPHPGPQLVDGPTLVECEYFVTERWEVEERQTFDGPCLLIPLSGESLKPGSVYRVDDRAEVEGPATLLRTYVP